MTYGVPYSFVPGTKAKADEVNANFIDVLNKIEDTNTRIDDAGTQTSEDISSLETKLTSQITTLEDKSANKDLSNLSTTGKNVLAGKASTSVIDGTWTYKVTKLCTAKSIKPDTTHTYSLSGYLPKDSNKYEILAGILVNLESSGCSFLYMKTDFMKSLMPVTRLGSSYYGGAVFMTVVSTGRTIAINQTAASNKTPTYDLQIYGYRKVR